MKNTERAIFDRMSRRFVQSSSYAEGGNLFPETPVVVSQDRARIPDVSFFTKEQIAASERGEQPIPSFVVEIISPNEEGFKIEQKALDYFNAGVRVLWQIYSNVRMVKVFTSPRRRANLLCAESMLGRPGYSGPTTDGRRTFW